MADETHDAVIVGAGHAGPYCGRNGFKAVCEGYDLPRVWQKPDRLY